MDPVECPNCTKDITGHGVECPYCGTAMPGLSPARQGKRKPLVPSGLVLLLVAAVTSLIMVFSEASSGWPIIFALLGAVLLVVGLIRKR